MSNKKATPLPLTPRSTAALCLGVSPALKDVCAFGWHDLAVLLLQAEGRERCVLEHEEALMRSTLTQQAYDEEPVPYNEEDGGEEEEDDGAESEPYHVKTPRVASNGQSHNKSAEVSYAASSSSSCSHSRFSVHKTDDVSAAPSLTPFQRFCFTKSTANRFCQTTDTQRTPRQQQQQPQQERKSRSRTLGTAAATVSKSIDHGSIKNIRSNSNSNAQNMSNGISGNGNPNSTTFLATSMGGAATQHDYVAENYHAAACPSPRAGPTTFAAVASPQRDEWSWSHTRSRDVTAPAAVPTLARTYGSPGWRAASMELLFERLSYESKVLVARQAESLGLLSSTSPLFVPKWAVGEQRQGALGSGRASRSPASPPTQLPPPPQRKTEQDTSSEDAATLSTSETQHADGSSGDGATATPFKDGDATVLDCVSETTQTVTDAFAKNLKAAAAGHRTLSPAPVAPL